MILVTGATGKTGGDLARRLAAGGAAVRTVARNAEKAQALRAAGIEVVAGDATDAALLATAMRGVQKLVVIFPNGPAQLGLEKGVVDAAVSAKVQHIVKLSSMEALPGATNAVHRAHNESEAHIRASGIAWTMVRPNFFLQNFFGNAHSIKTEGKFSLPMGNGVQVMTDVRDVGAFLKHVVTTAGHSGQSYDVTGPKVMTFAEVAAAFSEALGKKVEYIDQDPVSYKAHLGKFVTNPWHLDAVCDIFREIREGYTPHATDTFQRIMERPPTSTQQFVADYRALFS